MSSSERITDPRRIRALAHPLRIELLEHLGEAELTATECAERTGESVASCSFHLRSLAKYGYIEQAERRGREKPWRLVTRSRDMRPDFDDPASLRALSELAGFAVEHEVEHVRRWVSHIADEAPEWVDASTITASSFWATREELAEVSRTLQEIADRFAGREDDPSLRPPGARPIRTFAVASVHFEREERESEPDGARVED